jgi:hypothetical protein
LGALLSIVTISAPLFQDGIRNGGNHENSQRWLDNGLKDTIERDLDGIIL